MKRHLPPLALIGLLLATPARAGVLEDGVAAYEAQDYATAKRLWESVEGQSSTGALWAKYYLGILYEYGLGVERNLLHARSLYANTFAQISRVLFDSDAVKTANRELPIDAVHRMAMIDYQVATELERSDDKAKRNKAKSMFQELRVALDIAGFYRNAASFFENGVLSEHGVGKGFVRDEERAWAYYTMAARLGHPEAAQEAERLAKDFSSREQKEAETHLKEYARFVLPPQ